MKRRIILSLLMTVIASVGLLAGCGETAPKELRPDQVLSVINSAGKTISIGDTREQVTKITGKKEDPDFGMDFADGVERVGYAKSPGIYLDYLKDQVVAIRLSGEGDWSYQGGVGCGQIEEDATKIFNTETHPHGTTLKTGGFLLSYDADLNPIAADLEAPYVVVIKFERNEDKEGNPSEVRLIKIENNLILLPLQ